jgi:hypothetical protein
LCVLFTGLIFTYNSAGKVKLNLEGSIKNQAQKKIAISPDYGNVPLYFIPNKGQVSMDALFYARASGYTLRLTKKGLIFGSKKVWNGYFGRTKRCPVLIFRALFIPGV